jgi:hypothetical protein
MGRAKNTFSIQAKAVRSAEYCQATDIFNE